MIVRMQKPRNPGRRSWDGREQCVNTNAEIPVLAPRGSADYMIHVFQSIDFHTIVRCPSIVHFNMKSRRCDWDGENAAAGQQRWWLRPYQT